LCKSDEKQAGSNWEGGVHWLLAGSVFHCTVYMYNVVITYWAFTRSDRRTDKSDRPVGPTGRSDDRIV